MSLAPLALPVLSILLPVGYGVLGEPSDLLASVESPGDHSRLAQEAKVRLKSRLEPVLLRYCGNACELIDSTVEIEESLADIEDIGFESISGKDPSSTYFVKKISVRIQADGRVTSSNRSRLESILSNHILALGYAGQIEWVQIRLPRIGGTTGALDAIKRKLRSKIDRIVDWVVQRYCPTQCLHARTAVEGQLIAPDDAESLSSLEVVEDSTSKTLMKVEEVGIDMEFDETLGDEAREQIVNILRARTKFVNPVIISQSVSRFPEPYLVKKNRLQREAEDPYGLEKLRRMLTMFRELAGTKEIITTETAQTQTEKTSTSESSSSTDQTRSETSSDSVLNKEKTETERDAQSSWIEGVPNWVLIVSAALAVLVLLGGLAYRLSAANRDANYMINAARGDGGHRGDDPLSDDDGGAIGVRGGEAQSEGDLALKMRVDEIREELIEVFLKNPKVAREAFTRMIHEEGVEKVSKYVHIFGHMVVLELLSDPNLNRELYELSEYYHRSEFDFDLHETLDLLIEIRTKVTASRIKVLSQKSMDQFEFLANLDPTQVHSLIVDERPMVQSIVLTQLDHKIRRSVFDMFDGQPKVELMRELCRASAIPKDYLANVAKALHKKVVSKPQFDTENLRSADILLDLLDKSTLDEQRELMRDLDETNHDAARAIKLKLVTVELLPYLKGGHLLEIVLGMDRDDLLTFLSGSRDGIRNLLLSKAPPELAESWMEELATVSSVDESRYQMVEMQVVGRIRSLASKGVINLLELNDMIFGEAASPKGSEEDPINPGHVVA